MKLLLHLTFPLSTTGQRLGCFSGPPPSLIFINDHLLLFPFSSLPPNLVAAAKKIFVLFSYFFIFSALQWLLFKLMRPQILDYFLFLIFYLVHKNKFDFSPTQAGLLRHSYANHGFLRPVALLRLLLQAPAEADLSQRRCRPRDFQYCRVLVGQVQFATLQAAQSRFAFCFEIKNNNIFLSILVH